MKLFIFTIAVLSTITKITIAQPETPGILWQRTYFENRSTSFYYAQETADQGFIVGGCRYNSSESYNQTCTFRMDVDGNLIWEYGVTGWYSQSIRDIEELPDGGFICVGKGQPDVTIKFGIAILRLDIDGSAIWVKYYGIPNKNARGECITQLPYGGFAVGGYIAHSSQEADAWVLRMDNSGDTLWTRTWEEGISCCVRQILYEDNELTVLMRSLDPDCPYIVRYDLDGNELCEMAITGLAGEIAQNMCLASDDGYIVLTSGKYPLIAHVDSLGQVLWTSTPSFAEYGRSISPTMDGGYIFSGRNQTQYLSSFSKFSSDGTEEWLSVVDYNQPYFIEQLSQGGYIATGKHLYFPTGSEGFLIRFEAETGIGEMNSYGNDVFSVSPNPFSSILSIGLSLPETEEIGISVYDISGRLIETLSNQMMSLGEYTLLWNPNPTIPNGNYLICTEFGSERVVKLVVLLR